ncbi:MAG: Sb-PDE family phosphodiesterase [Rhodothermales bacterium]
MRSLRFFLLLTVLATPATAQHGRLLVFPDVPGYVTLKCDFHQHTVFSDGSVWPNIRVQEALRDGLDAISLTEHLEYQPHGEDIPHRDRNRSLAIAKDAAGNSNLMLVHGSEITRDMPPGHTNAIFINDANKLLNDDPLTVFREANSQGAFVFWNHPNWTAQRPDGVARLTDLHRQFLREGLLHGIEVVNEHTYSDEALQIALDHDLTIMGTSDIHGLIDWDYNVPHGHRPITLVLARERSQEAIKEALFDHRTVVFFKDMLIGRESHLTPLVAASLRFTSKGYDEDESVLEIEIENVSSSPFVLLNASPYSFHEHTDLVLVEPQNTTTLYVKTLQQVDRVELAFDVMNAVTAPNTHPRVTWTTEVR